MGDVLARNKKHVEKQRLRSISWLSTLALIIALGIILNPIIRSSRDEDREKAITRAQSLAYQVIVLESKRNQSQANSADRSIASVSGEGTIGTDPWGQPFHYKIRTEGRLKVVDVWSLGENGIKTQVLIPDGYFTK